MIIDSLSRPRTDDAREAYVRAQSPTTRSLRSMAAPRLDVLDPYTQIAGLCEGLFGLLVTVSRLPHYIELRHAVYAAKSRLHPGVFFSLRPGCRISRQD